MQSKHLRYTLLLILILSCDTSRKFDTFYAQQSYQEAYTHLKTYGDPLSFSYRERELKALLHLTISHPSIYLPLLDNALLQDIPKTMTNWHQLSRSWIRFLSATTDIDYQNILNLIPEKPFKEQKAEQLRLIIKGTSLLNLSRYQEVLSQLKASELTAKTSDLLYIQGLSEYHLQRYTEAKNSFQQLLSLASNTSLKSLGYYYLGMILSSEGDLESAQSHYRRALDLNPYQAEINFQMGKALQKQSYKDLPSRFYRASLRLNEDLAEAWYYLNIQ